MPRLAIASRVLVVLSALAAWPGHAAPPAERAAQPAQARPRTISIDEIRPGMTGYGLTVLKGTTPERFPIEVVSIMHNVLPHQDLILVRADDPRIVHTGVAMGMSGSPVYIEGRLAGALAYAWHFSKEPIAGVTPIANMQAELKRPLRGAQYTPTAEARRLPSSCDAADPACARPASLFQSRPSVAQALADYRETHQAPLLHPDPLPAQPPDGGIPSLVRAAVPLAVAGLSGQSIDELARALKPYHVVPLAAAGAARSDPSGPRHFENGGAIAVELIRGDVTAAATGTVTLVDGNHVLAFGHPMFNVGEIYLPIATAEVNAILPAYSASFKFATPLNEVGSLTQDRQSCIVGDLTLRADMIPVHVRVGGPGRDERTYNASVVRHRFLTPMLAASVVSSAIQESASDVADASITVRTNLDVRGHDTLSLIDHAFSADGLSQRSLAGLQGMRVIGDILFNPFAPTNLDRIDVQAEVDFRPAIAEIVGISLRTDELEAPSRPSLTITLRPYNGPEYSEAVPLDIPASLAGAKLKIEAAAGNLVKPDMPPPENLGALLDSFTKTYPARSIVVTVQTPDEGLFVRGRMVPDLPASVKDTLRPSTSSRRGEAYKLSARIVIPTRQVIQGRRDLQARVKDALAASSKR